MQQDLATCRHLLSVTYRRYIDAELERISAIEEMHAYFPPGVRPHSGTIGEPGSRIRKYVEQSERALLQLQSARAMLQLAKRRMDQRRGGTSKMLLLTVCAN